jgi:hypothetical protein
VVTTNKEFRVDMTKKATERPSKKPRLASSAFQYPDQCEVDESVEGLDYTGSSELQPQLQAAASSSSSNPVLQGVFGNLQLGAADKNTKTYLKDFSSFLRARKPALVDERVCDALDALANATSFSSTGASRISLSLTAFEEYGCALLGLSSFGSNAEVTTRLHILGPDEWAFAISSSRVFTTQPPGCFVNLCAGEVRHSELSSFLQDVHERLKEATQIKGNARSAGNGKQGHQKTPSFILALVQDALAKTEEPVRQPRGGFTDVGLHTGGQSRETAWPLASSVSQFVVEQLGACHFDYEIIIAKMGAYAA